MNSWQCPAVFSPSGCTNQFCAMEHPAGYITRCPDMVRQGVCRWRNCYFYHQPPMFQASRGNMYSPVGRGGIVNEWGGNDGASNFASSSRVRRGRRNSGCANRLMQQQPKKADVKKLENELRVMREDKKVMERKFGQMEELLKIKEGELAAAVAENNKFKVEKDFEVQFDKSWKESYETQIRNLKAELETLKEEPVSAMEKSPNSKKKSPIVKKKLASAKKKLADVMKKMRQKYEPEHAMLKCNTCDLMFKTTGLLRRHTRLKHSSVLTNNKKAGDDFGDDATVITAVEIDNQ